MGEVALPLTLFVLYFALYYRLSQVVYELRNIKKLLNESMAENSKNVPPE